MTMHEVVHEMVVGECNEPNSEGSGSAWKAYMNARVAGLFLLVLLEYPNELIPSFNSILRASILLRNDLEEINLELQSGTHKVIEKLSQEKVSQEEALEKFKWKVERDHEIKILGEVNVELESGTKKLREKLSQEDDSKEEVVEEFNSTLDNVLEKLSQEKDSPNDFYGFMYDTDDVASISGKSYFFVGLDQSIQDVVVQNNVQQEVVGEVVLYPHVHEDVVEEVIEVANDQASALSDQEVADECLDDDQVKERRPIQRIKVIQEEMVKDKKPKKVQPGSDTTCHGVIVSTPLRAGGRRTLKLVRKSSNKADGSPLVKISAY
uniref:Uncharacterized protein n=1 Tax=Tanacetum cinerariifolium TaxID=118510 RepID=A0A699H0D7_TANCI|nr:hypothetical protein [Tanacetum cinerariifolium]